MSLVPDKVRKAKKLVDVDKLDAFVDEGLAKRAPVRRSTEHSSAATEYIRDAQSKSSSHPSSASSQSSDKRTVRNTKSGGGAKKTPAWQNRLAKAPSVAFSVRIPTPLLERMRDVVAAVDGETLTSLLVEGATERVAAIETSYEKQVGQALPNRQEKVEL